MSGAGYENNQSPRSQLSVKLFWDLLDSITVDVASECHRIARLGLERNLEKEEEELRLSEQARETIADTTSNGETNKYVVDIFGQTHPTIASDIFDCMNCGRSIVAGRFAPHLEKCMGKGRKTRQKTTRSSTNAQNRQSRTKHNSRVANGMAGSTGTEYPEFTFDE